VEAERVDGLPVRSRAAKQAVQHGRRKVEGSTKSGTREKLASFTGHAEMRG
jgi:hypothetical protein